MNIFTLNPILRAPADGGGGIGVDLAPAPGGETPPPDGETPPAWEGPDWVAEKFRGSENPIEAQAQAYSEAVRKLSTKTEDLRKGIEEELTVSLAEKIKAEIAAERGAPEDAAAYAYPEGYEAPAEAVDTAFREWAHKHGLSQEAFDEAVAIYGSTQIDFEAERAKLGDDIDTRVAAMNAWGSRTIPPEMHATAQRLMQTAEGFELFEHLMLAGRDAGYSPPGGEPSRPMTREQIRDMQNDPRWYDPMKREDAYVAKVQRAWADYAKRQGGR